MYGMIWLLAAGGYQDPVEAVQNAQEQYETGLKIAKMIPDKGRPRE
jgi:hypothetical protein